MTPPSTDAMRFEALYRTHYAAIVRFVHRRSGPASAEEIVADTFAIAWRRLDDVPPDPLPWLYVVARNLLRSERRSAAYERGRVAGAAQEASLAHGRDPADALAERDAAVRAFSSLSEPDGEVLRLVLWEGLDQRSAARALGTSRVAFGMRLARARRRLTAALSPQDEPGRPLGITTSIPESQT